MGRVGLVGANTLSGYHEIEFECEVLARACERCFVDIAQGPNMDMRLKLFEALMAILVGQSIVRGMGKFRSSLGIDRYVEFFAHAVEAALQDFGI